jgi:hypothetical protein
VIGDVVVLVPEGKWVAPTVPRSESEGIEIQ